MQKAEQYMVGMLAEYQGFLEEQQKITQTQEIERQELIDNVTQWQLDLESLQECLKSSNEKLRHVNRHCHQLQQTRDELQKMMNTYTCDSDTISNLSGEELEQFLTSFVKSNKI